MSQLFKEFEKRKVKTICLSIDSIEDHKGWVEDVKHVSGCTVPFPLVADEDGAISEQIGTLNALREHPAAPQLTNCYLQACWTNLPTSVSPCEACLSSTRSAK